MPRFTIVANTPKPVLYLDFQGESAQVFWEVEEGYDEVIFSVKMLKLGKISYGNGKSCTFAK